MNRRVIIVGAMLVGGVLAGCVLVASSSNDYSAQPAPCTSSLDCVSDGGVQFCCVTYDPSEQNPRKRLGSQCSPSACGVLPQLCSVNNECGGNACMTERCFVPEAGVIAFSACGVVSCTTLGASPVAPDAGTDGAADAADAGSDAPTDAASDG